jgi:murein DD-endopeptidase MepM/ murein hydrolase activator NlpD
MRLALVAAAWLSIAASAPAITITHRARSIRPGEVVLLTVTAPTAIDVVRIHAFDRDWPAYRVTPQRWRALVGIDVEVAPGSYVVALDATSPAGALSAAHALTVAPRQFRTRTLTVDPAFVTPPESAADRIAQESRDLAAIYTRRTAVAWPAPFLRPVRHSANSAFGTRSVFNTELRNIHSGADFASPPGTPVKAPGAGDVVLARDLYFSGNSVVIDHGNGVISLLAHLSSIDVAAGDVVRAGTIVGRVGATGRVTGPHLHWSVRLNDARVDPLSLLFVLAPAR